MLGRLKRVCKLLTGRAASKPPPRAHPAKQQAAPAAGKPKSALAIQKELLSGRDVRTIFDVGANTGQSVAQYRAAFAQAAIYSFEPFPGSFEILRRKCEVDALCKCFQLAVSSKSGHAKLHANKDAATNSLFPTTKEVGIWVDADEIREVDAITVPVTTIDEFCEQQSVSGIDILKMDIQGGELLALQGAGGMLQRGAITMIFLEALFVPIYENQALFHEICEFLFRRGYTLFDLYNSVHAPNGQLKWCDALFLGPELGSAKCKAT
jgi:FkbM family methyltransferase